MASLRTPPQAPRQPGIEAPTIIVIGEVVRLRATLDWLGGTGVRSMGALHHCLAFFEDAPSGRSSE